LDDLVVESAYELDVSIGFEFIVKLLDRLVLEVLVFRFGLHQIYYLDYLVIEFRLDIINY